MSPNKNLSQRITRPATLGAVFGNVLRLIGARASDADLMARWEQIMGADIAARAALVSLSKRSPRTMTIRATVPAHATALSYQTDEIIARVNKYFGRAEIAKVVIRK